MTARAGVQSRTACRVAVRQADQLSLDTDSLLASHVTMAAAERIGAPHVLVLPLPAYHHPEWHGTVSLSASALQAMISDIAESAIGAGFRKLLLVTGHGGNGGPLRAD